ncbi:Cysteine/Histidine-rich C1 domain family protein [Raphanus sativus]|nr:Cysteine/Histidine-rich C1 domain family protein [Raphanus sativus]
MRIAGDIDDVRGKYVCGSRFACPRCEVVQSRRDLDVSMESFWREDKAVKNGLVSSEACLFQSSDERDGELVKFRRVRDGGGRVEADCDACHRIRAESSTCLVSSTRQTFCRRCIYLPKVIKITRHSHRLSLVLRISDGKFCEICWERVDIGYGGYSCIDKTCSYVIHPNCMIRSNVWDGKDVEGEPEEEEEAVAGSEVDDVAPLLLGVENIDGESVWRHFSHDHDLSMRVVEDQESEELCRACILPTYKTGKFLRCKQCGFALHETCANLPRKMGHGLHVHPVTLHVETTGDGFFTCSVCNQYSCGLMSYICIHKECGFKMDVKCASFVEPFYHTALPCDTFYLGVDYNKGTWECYGCEQRFSGSTASARNTDRIIFDFRCLNLPGLVKYKCDDHPLTLDYDYIECNNGWCEICEESIEKNRIFYTCHQCITTLHVDCILGKYPYLKSGHRIKVNGFEVEIASNDGASRPICQTCHRICQDKQVVNGKDQVCFCSIECIPSRACS